MEAVGSPISSLVKATYNSAQHHSIGEEDMTRNNYKGYSGGGFRAPTLGCCRNTLEQKGIDAYES